MATPPHGRLDPDETCSSPAHPATLGLGGVVGICEPLKDRSGTLVRDLSGATVKIECVLGSAIKAARFIPSAYNPFWETEISIRPPKPSWFDGRTRPVDAVEMEMEIEDAMPDNRPNIVLLISHDLGCHIGPYGWAQRQSECLTRLAAEGMRFDAHFVTSPGCSQSRSSLVTGRYPHNNGQFGLSHLGWTLNRDEVLLPAALKEGGYQTVLFGIWHLHEWTLGSFDSVSPDASTRDASPEGAAEIASARAADWIRGHAEDEQPFYLHVGFFETHRPFCGTEAESAAARTIPQDQLAIPSFLPDNSAVRQELAELHHAVSQVDRAVAKILDALDETGQRDRTLVVFTADHGLPFPRAKGTLYDPGIQVALLARWPGRITPGSVCDQLTSNVDVMPTLLEMADVDVPSRVQGESFLPALTGESQSRREAIFAEKTYHEHYDPIRCVRTSRWKYIRNLAARPRLVMPSDVYNSPTRQSLTEDEHIWSPRPAEEIYDLDADPAEQHNLALHLTPPDEFNELRARLSEWMRATNDPLLHGPVPRPS